MTLQTPIAPIARFMPPVARTTMVEKPITMSMASVRDMAKRLKGETKPGAQLAKTIQKIITMPARPIAPDCSLSQARRPERSSISLARLMLGLAQMKRVDPVCSASGREAGAPDRRAAGPERFDQAYLQSKYFDLIEERMSFVIFFRSSLYEPILSVLISRVPESMKRAVCGVLMNGASARTLQIPLAKRSRTYAPI